MKSFADLRQSARRDASSLPRVRLALLADSATQMLVLALRGEAFDRGIDLDVFEAPFAQIDAQVFDAASELHAFAPDFTLVWHAAEPMLARFQRLPENERANFADRQIEHVETWASVLASAANTKATRTIYLNVPEIDDAVFGSFANKLPSSWLFQSRRLNYRLMEIAASRRDLFIGDLAAIAADFGRAALADRRVLHTTSLLLSVDLLPVVAARVLDIVDAIQGRARKCLILDLDNTLWGGVIGDDGLDRLELGELGAGHVYDELQAWAKALKERGIVLAVCSKNDSRIASEAFERHPDMTLRLADIAVFVANWNDKVDNIRHIQSVLEIGFDSMVFLDDNPAERAAIRMRLPEVCVPELPDDPVDWLPLLRRMNLFETAAFTGQDAERTIQYQNENKRREARGAFADDGEFLRSLEMVGVVEGFTPFNIPRVAQLTQRSNQFNLRTVRYDEAAVARVAGSAAHICLAVNLADRFGSHGLISVLILELANDGSYFIDTWLMSCRVLKRGVERLALNSARAAVRARGGTRIVGEYLPTPKNALVADHYRKLGFAELDGRWQLDLDESAALAHFIAPSAGDEDGVKG